MNKLMERLTQIREEGLNGEAVGLMEAPITTHMVKTMTKVKGMEDVIERNEQLSKTYQGFLNMYGFESMYDMYIYAKSCDIMPEGVIKSKDITRLVPVQRTIKRNGKYQEVTVYEEIYKSKEPNKNENDKREEAPTIRHAREFKSKITKGLNPKDVAMLKTVSNSLTRGNKPFYDKSSYYLELKDGDRTTGIVGYSEEGDHLKMDFHRSNGKISGVASRGFAELVNLAIRKRKGVIAEDNKQARPVYLRFGLQQSDDGKVWTISYDDLSEVFGKSGETID